MKLRIDGQEFEIRQGKGTLVLDDRELPIELVSRRKQGESWQLALRVGDRPLRLWATPLPDGSWSIQAPGGLRELISPPGLAAQSREAHGPLRTPMAGVVAALHVSPGQSVASGAPLAVVEAMKMRYTLTAEAPAVIGEVLVTERALVTAGQVLLVTLPLA